MIFPHDQLLKTSLTLVTNYTLKSETTCNYIVNNKIEKYLHFFFLFFVFNQNKPKFVPDQTTFYKINFSTEYEKFGTFLPHCMYVRM